jgi:Cyclin, C-terminal domain.
MAEVSMRYFSWTHLFNYVLFLAEPELIQTRPSLLATASISAAVRGLNSPSAATALTSVCALTRVDPAAAEHVVRHIERVVASETASVQPLPTTSNKVTSSASSSTKLMSGTEETSGQPETPTEVQDVHF